MAVRRRDSVSRSPRRRKSLPLRVESLEDRLLLALFLVNLSTDENDADPNDQACDIEPAILGDQCTLRAAIQQANFNVGVPDEINFNIGGGGPQTITPQSGLPAILDPVTINGASQPGFLPAGPLLIELNGQTAGAVSGLRINTMNATVSALVINRFGGSGITIQGGGNNAITANFIGTDALGMAPMPNTGDGISIFDSVGNRIGGPSTGDGNLISGNTSNGIGVFGNGSSQTLVQGNLIGLNSARTGPLANGLNGVHLVGSPNNLIGGQANTERNVISANLENGIRVSGNTATGNNIFGNFIGTIGDGTATDPDGVPGTGDELGNRMHGVQFDDAPGNFLGRTGAQEFNIIAGSLLAGVRLTGNLGTNNVLRNNFIGTNEGGVLNLGNSGPGIIIQDASVSTIGGAGVGERNVIAFNNGDGIAILNGVANRISRNVIRDNAALGINLFPPGPNFPQDPDPGIGANNLQNFPVLTLAFLMGGSTVIQGSLTSAPNTAYRLEFFDNKGCDLSGNGEGELFAGAMTVTTTPAGNVNFTATLATPFPLGDSMTATATDPAGNTSEFSACQPVELASDLFVTVMDSPDPVVAGNNLIYTILVATNGPNNATDPTVTVNLPASLTVVTVPPGCTPAGTVINCSFPGATLSPGDTLTLTIETKVASSGAQGAVITSAVLVDATEADQDLTNNMVSVSTSVIREVDLVVMKSESIDPVIAGSGAGNLTYVVTVTNNGPSDASGIVLSEDLTLPTGVTVVSVTPSAGTTFAVTAAPDGTWTVGDLAPLVSATLTVVLTVSASTADGAVVSDTATVTAVNETQIALGNETATQTTTVARRVDLVVTKAESIDPVIAGSGAGNLTYVVTVTNNGPSDASGIVLNEDITLPTGVTVVSVTPSAGTTFAVTAAPDGTWTVGSLAPLASATLTVVLTVSASTADGAVVSDTATVTAVNETQIATGNEVATETTTVARRVDLLVTKAESIDPVIAGSGAGNLTYVVSVRNAGPSNATGVVLSEVLTLPAGVVVDSITPSGITRFVGTTWTVGGLPAGATETLTVVLTVGPSTAAGADVISDIAMVTSVVEPRINVGDDNVTVQTSVARQADLSVAMIDSVDPVLAGNFVTYTIAVANAGPSDASGVTVTDTLPAGVLLLDSMPTQGVCIQPAQNLVICSLGDLPRASIATVMISVSVLGNVAHGTVITNAVVVAGNEADPVANNQAIENTTVNRESDLAVAIADSPDPIGPGGTLTYDLTVTTSPPSTADSVTVTDTLPAGVTFVSASTTCVHAVGVVTCTLGDLASGLIIPLQIRVRINAGTQGVITNTATVASATFDPVLSNNTSMVDTTVVPLDIRVTEFTQEGGSSDRMAITYEILGTAPIFDFRFFASPDVRFDAGDTELPPAFPVTNAADLGPGVHTVAFDAAPYGVALTATDVAFFVTRAFVRPVNGVVAPESDLTNNDLNFIGVFHVPGGPLAVRGRVDSDRRNGADLPLDSPDDVIGIIGGATTTVTGNIPAGLVAVPALGVTEVRILAGSGNDLVTATANQLRPIRMFGGTGDDIFAGGSGNDTFFGEAGDDLVGGIAGNDLLDGGDGIDTADFSTASAGVNVNLAKGTARGQGRDLLLAIENVTGSTLRDRITGNAGPNILVGVAGADLIAGGAGADAIDGGPGDDTVIGGDGDDVLVGGDGDDCVCGGAGTDMMEGNAGEDRMDGGDGDDAIRAGDGNDRVCGGDGTDMIMGEAGKDLIEGGAGVDMLLGGVGFDLFLFDLLDLPIDFGGPGADGGKAARG